MRVSITGSARVVLMLAMACAFIASSATPAFGAGPGADDSRVSITGPVRVGPGERIDGPVVSVDGPVRVDGTVDGDVLAVHGNVTVPGRVTGTVTALDGDIVITGRVHDGVTAASGQAVIGGRAVVGGDVRSSERPDVSPGAQVSGDVSKTNFAAWFTLAGWIALVLWWFAVTVTLLVLGLLFVWLLPRAAQRVATTAADSTGATIAWGAVLGIGVPVAAGVLAATLIGLPLGFAVLLMLAAAFPLGYVMTALVIGRVLVRRRGDIAAFLVGFAILRALALIPGLGWLLGFLAAAFGVGALAVSGWRAGRAPAAQPGPAAAPTSEPTPAPSPTPS